MATERKVKVPFNNQMRDGYDVPVEESVERWSDVKLGDGTTLRVKVSVISAIRVEGEYDPQGNPTYVLNAAPTMAVTEVPDRLRKKVN